MTHDDTLTLNLEAPYFTAQSIQEIIDFNRKENEQLLQEIQIKDAARLEHYHLNSTPEQLEQVPYLKYLRNIEAGTVVAGVAEMDLPISQVYRETMKKVADLELLGYTTNSNLEVHLREAFLEFMIKTVDLKVTADQEKEMLLTSHVMGAISNIIETFSQVGDDILVPAPSYTAFFSDTRTLQRNVIEVNMSIENGNYRLKAEDIAAAVTPQTKILLFSNPHNPTGRLFSVDEVQAILDVCRKHNILVVSDDIHCHITPNKDLCYKPMHNLAQAGDRVISLFSTSKAFNAPGLKIAFALFSQSELHKAFTGRIPRHCYLSAPVPSILAVQNLLRFGQPWLDRVNALIAQNKAIAAHRIEAIDDISTNISESTYLIWLDCRSLDQTKFKAALQAQKLVLSEGADFGADWDGFYRINLATSLPVVHAIFDRLEAAVQQTKK